MKKKFKFEFEDDSLENRITFEYDDFSDDEILDVSINKGTTTLYANREGFMVLAKTFVKIALGNYKYGFHIHLGKDFGDGDDIITITLVE
jgi:hypothetical protein